MAASSSIIRRTTGLASVAYYYFDCKDTGKQDRRGLVSSLLTQLCTQLLNELIDPLHRGLSEVDIHEALDSGILDITQLYIVHSANVYAADERSDCPFHRVVRSQRLDLAELLLSDVVELLAKGGADVMHDSEDGATASGQTQFHLEWLLFERGRRYRCRLRRVKSTITSLRTFTLHHLTSSHSESNPSFFRSSPSFAFHVLYITWRYQHALSLRISES